MSRLDQLRKMLAGDPEDPFLNFALAMEYSKSAQQDEALAQFNRVIELDRKYVPAYFQKANLLVASNKHAEAKAVFVEALAVADETGDKHAAAEIRDALALLG